MSNPSILSQQESDNGFFAGKIYVIFRLAEAVGNRAEYDKAREFQKGVSLHAMSNKDHDELNTLLNTLLDKVKDKEKIDERD